MNKPTQKSRHLRLQALENRQLLAAGVLDVSVENLAPSGGLTLTPAFVAFHNGSFRLARSGQSLSGFSGFEELAEDGIVSGLETRFDATHPDGVDAILGAPAGFAGAPVIEPGETATAQINVTDSESNRFFSYASMLIPSNDAFIANLNPRMFPVFDLQGRFTGPITFDVFGRNVYDAGTEVNDASGGAAFSTEGGTSTDEDFVVRQHTGLDEFIGTGTPTGDLGSAFDASTPIARITISLAAGETPTPDLQGPVVISGATSITANGFIDYEVSYSDGSGVNVASIDTNDLVIVGRRGQRLRVESVTKSAADDSDATQVTATYRITKPDGSAFTLADNGVYRVLTNPRQVTDVNGNRVRRAEIGALEVKIAQQLEVRIENLADDGGLTLTPLWVGFHDGSFDLGTVGQAASNFGGLEEIAEDGVVDPLRARFAAETEGIDAVLTQAAGFPGAPVIEPGEIATSTIDIENARLNPYFSYASMVIPSNDAFIANLNQRQFRVFDAHGRFRRPITIYVFGDDIYDSGTEVNNAQNGGAAFAVNSGTGADEGGVITRHAGLTSFVGVDLPTGEQLERAFGGRTPIAKITVGRPGATVPQERGRPTATAINVPAVTTAAPVDVVVEISDPSGIDVSQLEANDLIVIGRRRVRLSVVSVNIESPSNSNPRSVRATFRVQAADGTFTASDNGNYRIVLARNSVFDANGIGNRNINVGGLTVNLPS